MRDGKCSKKVFWPEGCGESFFELVGVLEGFEGIVFRHGEDPFFGEVKDHFADILAGADIPVIENGESHGAELLDGETAESV